jgi:arabinofuranosyltransferase
MTRVITSRNIQLLTCVCAVLAIVVFFKSFWVTEDAFIGYRVLEQFRIGNGPVWNAGIRVQIFSCIGWFYLLVIAGFFIHNIFMSLVVVNTAVFAFFLFTAKKVFGVTVEFCLFILFLLMSNSFYDYTSSGLDNILGFAFILYLYYRYKAQLGFVKETLPKKEFYTITFLTSMIVFARPDLILFSVPPFLYVVYKYLPKISLLFKAGLLAALPVVAWLLFSIVYYGKPLPNTAYLKIFNGIPEDIVLASGINYLLQHTVFDPYMLATIGLGFIGGLFFLEPWKKAFAVGMMAYFCYVISIGGEYMLGRFLSYPFLVAALLLTEIFRKFSLSENKIKNRLKFLITIFVVFGLTTTENPITRPWTYGRHLPWSVTQDADIQAMGVVNMRKAYYSTSSAAWFYNEARTATANQDSDVRFGVDLKKSGDKVAVIGATGATGYYAGTEIVLLDYFGLTDPFVAMLPSVRMNFTSHFEKELPEGYFESFLDEKNTLKDQKLDEYYRHIKLITTSKDLFTLERFKAIYKLNTGQYDYLLEDYRKDIERKRNFKIHTYKVWGADIEKIIFEKLGLIPSIEAVN